MGNFLRDYGSGIAPTAAIINGFIAVVVAQFFKDHRVAKIFLVAAAAILSAAGIGATFYSAHQIAVVQVAQDEKRLAMKDLIGESD
jgi:hypothetical protein